MGRVPRSAPPPRWRVGHPKFQIFDTLATSPPQGTASSTRLNSKADPTLRERWTPDPDRTPRGARGLKSLGHGICSLDAKSICCFFCHHTEAAIYAIADPRNSDDSASYLAGGGQPSSMNIGFTPTFIVPSGGVIQLLSSNAARVRES